MQERNEKEKFSIEDCAKSYKFVREEEKKKKLGKRDNARRECGKGVEDIRTDRLDISSLRFDFVLKKRNSR